MRISIEQLIVAADSASKNIDRELEPHICRHCRIPESTLKSYRIIRRSTDARSKPHVKLLYRLEAEVDDSAKLSSALQLAGEPKPLWTPLKAGSLKGRTAVVVGAGPAGLFAALAIAMRGGRPVVIDRGRDVGQRARDIQAFRNSRVLNEESNYLFGEGGAGTWSDGKLFTRINDERVDFVLREFIDCGASPAIGYFSHPHIGSDRLPEVIASLRKKIIGLGGEFVWGKRVESLMVSRGLCSGVILDSGEKIGADFTLIACGHSARPLIQHLAVQGVGCQLKGFQLGMRIEHPQVFINKMQYGVPDSYPALGAAEYNVVSRPSADGKASGVTSFCMCPGGEIIPATSETSHLCTNGMSNAARNSAWANAAIISTVPAERFSSIGQAYDFLEGLEAKCFRAGGSDYACPAQKAEDFVRGSLSGKLPDSSYCFGLRSARLDELLPREITASLRYALRHFDKVNPGFISQGVFVGIEARVSSPVRFLRNPETLESSLGHLYLAGEGAGMAGGITSAAVDGLKMAEAMQ